MGDCKSMEEGSPSPSVSEKLSTAVSRPTTLNILLDNEIKGGAVPAFQSPSLEDLQPLLRSELEKLFQQWKVSPQTPGSFLNPKHVTEEQELFANAFTKKLTELQDSNCLASLTAAAMGSNSLCNISLPEINSQNLPNFTEICRHAIQQQQSNITNPSILVYSPAGLITSSPSVVRVGASSGTVSLSSDERKGSVDLNNVHHTLQGSVSIALPSTSLSVSNKDFATVQLANGLKFEIKTNGTTPNSTVLKMLGLSTPSEPNASDVDSNQPQGDSIPWPLQVQTSSAIEGCRDSSLNSPHIDPGTRPSSTTNSVDHEVAIARPSSSISSGSSASQFNGRDNSSCVNSSDARLDPTEQYRMRLERKRARNRDAARKCRERKIRLIKSLEKDVYFLSEENKALRNRLSKSKIEVDRLKLFVVNHLEKECPAISSKVV